MKAAGDAIGYVPCRCVVCPSPEAWSTRCGWGPLRVDCVIESGRFLGIGRGESGIRDVCSGEASASRDLDGPFPRPGVETKGEDIFTLPGDVLKDPGTACW